MIDEVMAFEAVTGLLAALHVPVDPHNVDTPGRVVRAWAEALAGYDQDPGEHLERTFPAPSRPSTVIVTGVEVVSVCAHHLQPIRGLATVAYLPWPGERLVGLSKLARVVEGHARRLQVQERIGADVVMEMEKHLEPRAAGCVITAEHGCMSNRGVRQAGARTTTASWSGEWDDGANGGLEVLATHRAAL